MKIPRHLILGIALAAAGLIGLLLVSLNKSKDPETTSETLRVASELLAVQRSMSQNHLSGFLPGNHARLTDRLRRKKFTSVSIMPSLIIGSHSISVGGFNVGTHLVLVKDGPSNSWTVSEDVQLGSRTWKNPVGTLDDLEVAPTNQAPAAPASQGI